MGIGKKLSELLMRRKINTNELATALNAPPMTIYNLIKRDGNKTDIDLLIKLSNYLCVPIEYFGSEPLSTPDNFKCSENEKIIIKKLRLLPENEIKEVAEIIDLKLRKLDALTQEKQFA